MKLWALMFGVAGVGGALIPPPERPWTLFVTGDADGYLSPCGCTAPMTGGVRRRATALRQAGQQGRIVSIDTGGLGGVPGRQGELKAETAAQIAASVDTAAVHLTERDAAIGPGSVSAVARLAEGRVISTSLPPNTLEGVRPYVERGPFLIGGASAIPTAMNVALGVATTRAPEQAASTLVVAARARKKAAVLMFSGERPAAVALAKAVPGIGILIYRSAGNPPPKSEQVGSTVLVTPGEKGKHVLRLNYDGKSFGAYAAIRLGPEYADDPAAARIYATYLRRVDSANLLDRLPRAPSDPFAGTKLCGSCHQKAMDVWHASKHAEALRTLEKDGHGRDPDCVSCHVVGLEREGGFSSRAATPELTEVGCESCHGPGGRHAASPTTVHLPKVGDTACAPCHRPEQSPNFNFLTYWRKIAH